jgi:two-component system, OmpR family, response regulator
MDAGTVEVVTLSWPAEEVRRRLLEEAGVPRLLVLDGDQPPPTDLTESEEWIRVPALEIDRLARVDGLKARICPHRAEAPRPTIDEDGLVHVGASWVSVPPVEARLASVLIERFGSVVSRAELSVAAWPEGVAQRNALDVRILRLRRRIEALGLAIGTVRSRGYLLESVG